ncbi:MAG TPA: energy transducer TonB [Rhodanobacter sp.]|nr:energy transducer TonB [Rhodanobacter sp.]
MTKRLLATVLILLAMAASTAQAATSKDVELSAIVEGTIVLAPDGHVQDVVVPDAAKYGQPVVDMVRTTALKWRFDPVVVDGQPVIAKSSMHARVVLKKNAAGDYVAWVRGATFGDTDANNTSVVRASPANLKLPPRFPAEALHSKAEGRVYLALRIDRAGHVVDAVVEQVNLANTGPEAVLNRSRKAFADASLVAARRWSYMVPTTGKLAGRDNWTVRTSIRFFLRGAGMPKDGSAWAAYIPGPYTPAPWVDKPNAGAADVLADDTVHTDGAGPALLTALPQG